MSVLVTTGQMMGFAANKTKDQAVANAADLKDRLTVCTTQELFVNGQRVGITTNEASLLSQLNKSQATAALTPKADSSPSPFELHGYVNDQMKYFIRPQVTLTVKYNGANVQATNSAGTAQANITLTCSANSKTVVLAWDASSKTYSGKVGDGTVVTPTGTYAATVYCRATAHDKIVVSKSVSVNVQGGDYVYFGTSKLASITAASITAFDHFSASAAAAQNVIAVGSDTKLAPTSSLKTSAAGSYSFTFKDGEYAYLLIPSWMNQGKFASGSDAGGYHASEGVADVIFQKIGQIDTSTVSVNEAASLKQMKQTFNVYRLQSTQKAGTHSFTI